MFRAPESHLPLRGERCTAKIDLGGVNRRVAQFPSDEAEPAQTVRRLWRNVVWECALAAGVLLATEALAENSPPMPPG